MELTPEKFEKAEFAEKRRGYDIDQVETFLEETGTEFALMLAKFRQTEKRAAAAEARAADAEEKLSKVDATVAEARERVQRAEREAQAAISQAEAARANLATASSSPTRDDDAVEQVAKTLVMAQRAADEALNDADEQARSIVAEADGVAERQVSDAEAQAEKLLREMRVRADEEFASRRAAALEDVGALESRRSQLESVIGQLNARLSEYRGELSRTAEELLSLADDPAMLGERSALSIPPDEIIVSEDAPSVEDSDESGEQSGKASAADEEPRFEGIDDEPDPQTSDIAEPVPAGVDQQAEPISEPVVDLTTRAVAAASVTPGEGEVAEGTWGPGSWSDLEDSLDSDETDSEPESRSLGSIISATASTGVVRTVAAERRATSQTASLPEVEDRSTIEDRGSIEDRTANLLPPAAEYQPELEQDDRPTQAVPRAVPRAEPRRDRYMEELDQAVNESDHGSDDPMTAFLEGSTDSKSRRFGWRR